ncbi:glycosyltransferase family 4 protein [Streptococcus zalophi]|uniref:Glycosyltransferase family 4 protein n=1 Tax=Streptococcus zalophi TaxID=640031 RepID=A0A934UCV4_9STRE|nr:glycosyltransferase family 4 protein [Streptococcus zalophi]MBJ8349049.1 glycosyltransferase family 4 protein [Streptococcus zalophi]MCR8967800.1 glycosyltransferase family 4 protein [Streptococcus zalophi]
MKKNILFISPTGTLENGAEISITNLMTYLSELGYKVFNVFPNISHPTQKNYEEKMIAHNIKYYKLDILNWWWEEAPGILHGTKFERSFYYEKNINEIRNIIVDNNIDIVISNTVNVFQGAIAASLEKKKHIWIIHEFPKDEFDYYTEKIEFIDNCSDAIFAVDGPLTKKLKELFPKTTTIHSFIPMPNFSTSKLSVGKSIRFISISKINENKNQLELLTAYKELNRLDIPLIFIGDWDLEYKKKCDAYIEQYSLTNVSFLGNKEQPWNYVTDKDICVFTSKVETFGLVFLEAIRYGVPTIVSNNDGYLSISEMYRAGKIYEVGATESLKNQMFEILDDFSEDKLRAIKASEVLKENNPEHYYLSLIDGFDNVNRKNKVIDSLSSVIGNYNPNYQPFQTSEKFVSVYFSGDNNEFSEKTALRIPLRFEDTIIIQPPAKTKNIRVDLTETPNFFKSFSLVDAFSKQLITPTFSTHINIENIIIFDHADPQIIYNVEQFEEQEILFSYELLSISDMLKNDYLEKLLTYKNNKLLEIEKQCHFLNESNNELQNKYNAIVNSRRWQITTKLINLFRRKK